MGDGTFGIRGQVVNNSDSQVYCWVQDGSNPEIYVLSPGLQSPSNSDVDLVKAIPPATLNPDGNGIAVALWFKFHNYSTATISGASPNLAIDISLAITSHADQWTDDQALAAGGCAGPVEQYMNSAVGWGEPIPPPFVPDPSIVYGY